MTALTGNGAEVNLQFEQGTREILYDVIKRFVNLRKATPRLRLREKLKGKKDVLEGWLKDGYLVLREGDFCVPGILAFEAYKDPFLTDLTKSSLAIVLCTLQNLHTLETPKVMFTLDEVEVQAKRLYDFFEEEKIFIGLNLAAQVIGMAAAAKTEDGMVTSVIVYEDIIDFQNANDTWNLVVQERLRMINAWEQVPGRTFAAHGGSLAAQNVQTKPPEVSPDFSFMANDDLRKVVERDYLELQRLDRSEALKSTLVLAGGILEGVLLDALVQAGKWDPLEASRRFLNEMIGPAKNAGIISEDRLSDVVRKYRALIHPGRQTREAITFDTHDANLARSAVEIMIREIRAWHEKRKAAVVP